MKTNRNLCGIMATTNKFPVRWNTCHRLSGLAFLAVIAGLLAGGVSAPAQTAPTYSWVNFAGQPGSDGNTDDTGSAARFHTPAGVAVDNAGNVFVADTYNHTIRKITAAGVVTTFAGSAGVTGTNDATGSAARFNTPYGVAVDTNGNVYVADSSNSTIRKITPAGMVTTLAGLAWNSGSADGTGSGARFYWPYAVTVDSAGNVFVADEANHTIRKVTPAGEVTTLAGSAGNSGSADGTSIAAGFYNPTGVAVDTNGNVYVADSYNHTIRKVTAAGEVTTLAGSAQHPDSTDGMGSTARFYFPIGVAVDGAGNVFVADTYNSTIRKITAAGMVTTIGGEAGRVGSFDGIGSSANFNNPYGIAVDSAGILYAADSGNDRISKGTPGGLGSLQVTIVPAGAVSAGAQWRVDSGTWQNSGATVTNLVAGNHPVSFSTVTGWTAPSPNPESVTIAINQLTSLTRSYTLVATQIIGLSGSLAFGNVLTGTTATATLTITNNGNTALTVSSISYPSSNFSGAWSGPIAAGGSQTVPVTFAPAAVVSYIGTVTVNSDATSGTNTITASGAGVAAVALTKIIGVTGSLAFGNVLTGTTATATLTITNNGNTALTVSSISYPSSNFSGAWSGPIAAGGSQTVPVTFAPVTVVGYGGTVMVNSDATSGTNTITTSGTGVAAMALTKIIGVTGSLAFGNVLTGTTATAALTITNSGNTALTISGLDYPTGFSGAWSGSIPSGGSQNVPVTFAPAAAITYSGTVMINSDATAGPNTISATGIGSVSLVTNVVFQDDFNDDSIDPTKWRTAGNTVVESNHLMQVLTTVTDAGGYLTSTGFPVNATGKIIITRRAYLHYGNSYFIGRFDIGIGSLPGFSVQYANMDYNTAPHMARYGFFLARNGVSSHDLVSQADVSPAITPVWDTWFNEKVTYDPVSGIMEYFINDVGQATFNVGVLPQTNAPLMTLNLGAWGWYTGHQQLCDDLVVRQLGAAQIIGLSGSLAFGNVLTGTTATATLTITNNGNTTLTVSSISYPTGFSGAWSGAIAAGGAQNVTVTFAPAAVASYNGKITVNSGATSGTNTLTVSGTGVAAAVVATPTITPADGTFTNSVKVTVSCSTTKAVLRYTVNGSEPTSHSPVCAKAGLTITTNTTLKVKAFKGTNTSATATATFVIYVPPAPVIATDSQLPAATKNHTYTPLAPLVTLQVTTGTGIAPFKWALVPGSKLPAGLKLNATTGVISGKPTKTGTATFSIKVTDAKKRASETKSFSLTVN